MSLLRLFLYVLFLAAPLFGGEHWVYVRLENKVSADSLKDIHLGKAGDIVDVLPVCAQFVPSAKEKSVWAIFQADLNEYEAEYLTENLPWANRKFKVATEDLRAGINQLKYFEFEQKSRADLIAYRALRDRQRRIDYAINVLRWALPDPAYGAETVNTINRTGEDYNTLTLWEDARDGDISSGNDEVAECYDDDGDLADNVALGGWTTDSDSRIIIRAASGEETDGTIATGFRLSVSNSTIIIDLQSGADNVRIQDINIQRTGTGGASNIQVASSGSDIIIERCVLEMSPNSANGQDCAIETTSGSSATVQVRNLVAYNTESNQAGDGHGIHSRGSSVFNVYNCTFLDFDDAIENDGGTFTTTNVITFGSGTGFDGTFTQTTCISDDATANTQTAQAEGDLFTDADNFDFSVKDADSDLYDAGTDLSGTFTDDVARNSRSQWDVGAFEFQAGGDPVDAKRQRFVSPF